jgi:hypothetical protein
MAYVAFAIAGFTLLGILLGLSRGFGAGPLTAALFLCVVLPGALGAVLVRSRAERRQPDEAERAADSELLRLAERRGGSLTVAEAMAHADLTHGDAERRLERLCVEGLAEHRVSSEGVIVYRFERILSQGQRPRAAGLLDD